MVERASYLLCIFFLSSSSSLGVAQTESGLSLVQAWQANVESIRNYDVSFRHWIGFIEPELKSQDDKFSATEFFNRGRIVVDREQGRILYVHETTVEEEVKHSKQLNVLMWKNGMETSFSELEPFPSTVPRMFDRFCKLRAIPIVERCIATFPPILVKSSLAEDSADTIHNYESSTLLSRPDGSSTVALRLRNNRRYGIQLTFDPTSSMPTKSVFSEFDLDSGAFLKVHQSGNPRYEKYKEIYRVISLEYNEPLTVARNLRRDSVGTVQFNWHQFNENAIQFPDDHGSPFGIEEAKKFLSHDSKEKVK